MKKLYTVLGIIGVVLMVISNGWGVIGVPLIALGFYLMQYDNFSGGWMLVGNFVLVCGIGLTTMGVLKFFGIE